MRNSKSMGYLLASLILLSVFLCLWVIDLLEPPLAQTVKRFFPLLQPLTLRMDSAAEEILRGGTMGEAVQVFFHWGQEDGQENPD